MTEWLISLWVSLLLGMVGSSSSFTEPGTWVGILLIPSSNVDWHWWLNSERDRPRTALTEQQMAAVTWEVLGLRTCGNMLSQNRSPMYYVHYVHYAHPTFSRKKTILIMYIMLAKYNDLSLLSLKMLQYTSYLLFSHYLKYRHIHNYLKNV